MMYYCPCPCSDPIDADPEEDTFLALPRKLSYVQDSYLDAHSVSGRFVFNAHTERRIAAAGFCHDPNNSNSEVWRADATKVEATADVDYEGENGKGEGEDESASLLSVVKSQDFPISFGWDFNNSSVLKRHSQSVNGDSCVPDVCMTTSSSSSVLGVVTSSPSSSNSKPPSFISRVTSLISPKDESDSVKNNDHDLGSSVDAELTPDLSQLGPSHSVLRSPDRSGLTMDRGEDLIVSIHDDQVMCMCAIPVDDSLSPHGPDDFSDEELVVSKQDTTEGDGTFSDPVTPNESEKSKDPSQDESSTDSRDLGLDKSEISSNVIQTSIPCGSPDSDAFSEEGVFVNMMDDTEAVDKSTSEVSDDTNVSVDSMFWSPEEGEPEDDQNKVPRRMSLEEAISRAASDFNKMTMMMYPQTASKIQGEDNENIPGTSRDSAVNERIPHLNKGSPLRGLHDLSINISDCVDSTGSEHGQNLVPKESPIYEDHEFNFNKQGLRKSSSLKTNKTPPGTPHRKKVVRFADAMGLDLESVRHVLNMESPPKIPASAMADLKQGLGEDRPEIGSRYLTPCFNQPGASEDFVQTVIAQKVRLENAIITDLTITGFIRVANIAYHKNVRVRYTHNHWGTFHDIAASYIPNSCDGATDRFSFSIVAPAFFVPGNRLEFAVSYNAEGVEYWDNNDGLNYGFECFARTIPTENESGWMHFL